MLPKIILGARMRKQLWFPIGLLSLLFQDFYGGEEKEWKNILTRRQEPCFYIYEAERGGHFDMDMESGCNLV